MTDKVNTLKQLRIEKKRLLRKEIFLKDKIRACLAIEPVLKGNNPVSKLTNTFMDNPISAMRTGAMALPAGRLKTIFKTLTKFSWILPLINKYFLRLK